jgi:hypothetical protein
MAEGLTDVMPPAEANGSGTGGLGGATEGDRIEQIHEEVVLLRVAQGVTAESLRHVREDMSHMREVIEKIPGLIETRARQTREEFERELAEAKARADLCRDEDTKKIEESRQKIENMREKMRFLPLIDLLLAAAASIAASALLSGILK